MNHADIEKRAIAERYLERSLKNEEISAFESHLTECEECRDRVLLAAMFRARNVPAQAAEPPPKKPGREQVLHLITAVALAVSIAAALFWFKPISQWLHLIRVSPQVAELAAPSREEALKRILNQCEVVLGMEQVTLGLIRVSMDGDEHTAARSARLARRLSTHYADFREEYRNLLLLYKANEKILQQQDILFLQPAIHGAENIQNQMRQLQSMSLQ